MLDNLPQLPFCIFPFSNDLSEAEIHIEQDAARAAASTGRLQFPSKLCQRSRSAG